MPSNITKNEDYAIEVNDVTMVFNMASEQLNSLKEYFIKIMKHELFFEEFKALKNISFKIKRGETVGLVGTNGSGKSTMLKVIAGVLEPTSGNCVVHGNIAPLIELGAGFDYELTARENIYLNGALLGYTREFIDSKMDEIIEFAELEDFMDMPLKNYSSGMTARIAFAIATITEPDVLIVDETLSVGDVFFQRKCEKRIKRFVDSGDVTVLLVSHSMDQVERICERAIWIEKGTMRMDGAVEDVCQAYREQFAFTDITEDTPHAKEIWWLARQKISTGYPDSTFPSTTKVQQRGALAERFGGGSHRFGRVFAGRTVKGCPYGPPQHHRQRLQAPCQRFQARRARPCLLGSARACPRGGTRRARPEYYGHARAAGQFHVPGEAGGRRALRPPAHARRRRGSQHGHGSLAWQPSTSALRPAFRRCAAA